MITVFDKPCGTIVWNEELQAVELTWSGHVSSEEYRETVNVFADTLRARKSTRMLVDTRNIRVILPEDQTWTNEVFVPKVSAAGLKKMATVMPENAVAQMSVEKLVRKAKDAEGGLSYELVYFDNVDKARAWLK